jgi:hypothetical protein
MSSGSAVRPLAPSSSLRSALVVAGAVGTGVAVALQPSEGWAGLLTAGLYGVTLALGGALFLDIQVVSGGRWWFPLRRVPLRLAATLPVPLAAVALALVLGLQSLYPWARAAAVEASALLQAKRAWLNAPLFLARAVVVGLVWLVLVGALRSALAAAIQRPSPEARRRLVRSALVFLPVFALTLSVAAWDWGMSLEPEWFSTMYGVLLFAGTFQGGIAAVTVLALLLDRQGRLDAPLGAGARHDLGKLLFAFSTFWAYAWFCQYMLIWYANLPEETGHYAARFADGWSTLFWLVPILRTVAPGSSVEVSNLALSADAELTPIVRAHATVHVIDLYNRNPTSSDDLVALREAWVLVGRRQGLLEPIRGTTLYARLGKAPRFTKPLDRHLESYGLWGTAVGRFEEIGIEVGGSFGRHVYWRGLVANGNPLFFRDPNALAGDNGTPERTAPNPDPKLESGFPILYDAKAQDLRFDGSILWGGGVGVRLVADDPDHPGGVDLLGWYFEREMAEATPIRGSFYEGDLDLLRGAGIPLPFEGRRKREYGANLAGRWGGLRVHGLFVDQDVAGLRRRGFEAEAAFRVPLGGLFASGDEPVFNWIQPAVRYSTIDNRFAAPSDFVAPSVAWDWTKLDLGLRLGILRNLDLTLEYARHAVKAAGGTLHPDEALVTVWVSF